MTTKAHQPAPPGPKPEPPPPPPPKHGNGLTRCPTCGRDTDDATRLRIVVRQDDESLATSVKTCQMLYQENQRLATDLAAAREQLCDVSASYSAVVDAVHAAGVREGEDEDDAVTRIAADLATAQRVVKACEAWQQHIAGVIQRHGLDARFTSVEVGVILSCIIRNEWPNSVRRGDGEVKP